MTAGARDLRWVAIGDSYTIGTSVAAGRPVARPARRPPRCGPSRRRPAARSRREPCGQRLDRRRRRPPPAAAGSSRSASFGFASLLVGVNDVVQGVPETRFRDDAAAILDALLGRLAAGRILVVETPDYTVTPMGAAFGEPTARRAGIVAFNAVLAALSAERGITFVDGILAISTDAASDPALVASDGLHPSAAQYRRWVVERMEAAVGGLLARP